MKRTEKFMKEAQGGACDFDGSAWALPLVLRGEGALHGKKNCVGAGKLLYSGKSCGILPACGFSCLSLGDR